MSGAMCTAECGLPPAPPGARAWARQAAGCLLAGLVLAATPAFPAPAATPPLRILVTRTRAEAEEALARIRAGQAFERVVRDQSTGPERDRGGYVPPARREALPEEVRAAAAQSRPGRLSGIVRAGDGYAVIQVLTEAEEEALLARWREAAALVSRGIERGRAGSVEEAAELLQRAVDGDPGLQDAHFNLAIALWRLGRPDEAIATMEQASRLRPDDLDAHLRLGAWLLERRRPAVAAAHYERATALEPTSSALWQRLAESYEAAGKTEAAHRAYGRLLGLLEREDPAVLAAMLRTAIDARDGPRAVEAARRLRPHRPGHDGLVALAEALVLNGEPEAATRELEMAVALSPASTRPRLLLAETYVALGRLDAAADQLLHVVRLEPDQPRHYRDLSRLYARSGRRDLAIVALRDGLAMAASLPPAQSRELLEELAAQYEQAGMTREAARERRRASELGAR